MVTELNTLIIAFRDKDEMYSNQLRKLIHMGNVNSKTEEALGTENDSINIVAWNEEKWIANKGTVDATEKVLFLGEVKGSDQLIPVIDEKYNNYGIKYGWAGNQAIIYVDSNVLRKKEDYDIFLKVVKEKTDIRSIQKDKKLGFNKKTVFKGIGILFLPYVWPLLVGSLIKDAFEDADLVRNQQYLLGIFEFYRNGLEKFMKEK